MRSTVVLTVAFALLSASLSGQSVIVVDWSGGGDVTTLQAGIDAAVDGDILLVKPGSYTGLFGPTILVAKSLDIIGDGGRPELGSLTIRDLPAGGLVRLRNVGLGPLMSLVPLPSLVLHDNAGQVWVEGAVIEGGQGTANLGMPSNPGQPAIDATNCAAVTLVRCTLTGGAGAITTPIPGITDPSAGGPAFRCSDSDVAAWECVLTGGVGGHDFLYGNEGENGGHAVDATMSSLFFSGSAITGGRGANGCNTATTETCSGGDGLHLAATSSSVQLDSTFLGGEAGTLGGGGSSFPGDDMEVPPGCTTQDLPGPARSLSCTALARSLDMANLTYDGETGDFFGLFLSIDALFVPVYGKRGVYHLGTLLLGPTVLAPVTNPAGTLSMDFPAWDLSAEVLDGLTVDWQAFVRDPSGKIVLTSPSTFTDVQASF